MAKPDIKDIVSTEARAKGGRNAAASRAANRKFEGAIRKALTTYKNGRRGIKEGQALDRIGKELVACATDRNNPNFQFAVREIGLRVDGKPDANININDSDGIAATALGISAAFAKLSSLTGRGQIVDGEVVVQDRPVLPSEVCPKKD